MSTGTPAAVDPPVLLISAEQVDPWAGRRLTNDQLQHLAEAIPNSSIPGAIDTIVNEAIDLGNEDACRDPFGTGLPRKVSTTVKDSLAAAAVVPTVWNNSTTPRIGAMTAARRPTERTALRATKSRGPT